MELISDFGLSSNDFRLLSIFLLLEDFFDLFDLEILFSDVEDAHEIVLDESLRGAFLRELFFLRWGLGSNVYVFLPITHNFLVW